MRLERLRADGLAPSLDGGDHGTERLCEFCDDNPAEPGVSCCDNGFCKAEWLDTQADR